MNNNDFNNPYCPPSAVVSDARPEVDANFLSEPKSVPAGNAMTWIGNAWNLFKQQPGLWILLCIVYFILSLVLGFIPFIGSIAQIFITPILLAGFMCACEKLRTEGSFEFGDMFAGFQKNTGSLMIIGLLGFVFMIIVFIVMFIFVGAAFATAIAGSSASANPGAMNALASGGIGIGFLIAMLVIVIAGVLYGAAIYLAPALIILQDIAPMKAVSLSFAAFKKNILGAILCGIIMIALCIMAVLPLLLGFLVVGPLMMILQYTVYRDLFFKEN